jgi:hypothetical protein
VRLRLELINPIVREDEGATDIDQICGKFFKDKITDAVILKLSQA